MTLAGRPGPVPCAGGGLTPMMAQYRRVKDRHPDAIVLFRLGDFYETFFEDAALLARELEITLTSREAGKGRRVPMAGIPHHAAEGHIARLLDRGHRVALCDQVEDPAQAKGLVRREVTRVITPGTTVDARSLSDRAPNYLAAVARIPSGTIGLAVCEFSTGEWKATEFAAPSAGRELLDELLRLVPREILLDPSLAADGELLQGCRAGGLPDPRPEAGWVLDPASARRELASRLGTVSLEAWGLADRPAATVAACGLWSFVRATQREAAHLTSLRWYSRGDFMCLDHQTRRNLELVAALRDGKKHGSLLWALDATLTPMGGRMLRAWVLQPLTEIGQLRARQAAVAALVSDAFLRAELRGLLGQCQDLERLIARAGTGLANARDLAAIAATMQGVPRVKALLGGASEPVLGDVRDRLDPLPDTVALLERAIAEQPPGTLQEGGLIRPGYSEEVDRLRGLRSGGKGWIAALEAKERERTGIRSLRTGFNRVFGYYLEITRANLQAVPDDYVRRQTLANAERFVTPELKERESEILGAEERLFSLEYELFLAVRAEVAAVSARLQATAAALAELDCLAGLAEVAATHGYVRPELTDDDRIEIAGARHPVLERLMDGGFVPNDLVLGADGPRLLIITGPNMAGKSTYLRQSALIALMAQIGSFVPAKRAVIGPADRIFTRIGAQDDLAAGQSTFMVEMQEVAQILRHATRRSLVILDEVGRGTSTFDGISLARAVVEELVRMGPRTLFATHYHELTGLEPALPGVANYCTAVLDRQGEIVFAHKIRRGGADRSYGIEVARLAGLPPGVLGRARALLAEIESMRLEVAATQMWVSPGPADVAASSGPSSGPSPGPFSVAPRPSPAPKAPPAPAAAPRQISFLEPPPDPIIDALRALDLYRLTPIDAMNLLAEWQLRLAGSKERRGR
ncbi:MAG: DNA mismatch repair protein MutS [Bacillota bacterium]|nr:DNA mismatch repair protein MutS [Bacillota bacterium]